MRSNIKILILTTITLCLSSCYSYKSMQLLQENEKYIPTYEKSNYAEYRIQVNDEIIYRLITSDETISKLISPQNGSSGGGGSSSGQSMMTYRVHPDGSIDLPFVNHIPVKGLTLLQASKISAIFR